MEPCLVREKEKVKEFLWRLWKECFGDSDDYMNFYFKTVYKQNQVYQLEDRGMLHLNPYLVHVCGKEQVLPYIVGVATTKEYRRTGVMRKMLLKSFLDMYEQNIPFTYLMPADTAYYEPFSFISISKKKEDVIRKPNICNMEDENKISDELIFVPYEVLKEDEKRCKQAFLCIEEMLAKRYVIYAKHDKEYFSLLYNEKKCQQGNVIFVYKAMELVGFFAYSQTEEEIYVEQYVYAYADKKWLTYFNNETKQQTVIDTFPYMIRIIHAYSFMEVFKEVFRMLAISQKSICLVDKDIPNNNGWYHFKLQDNKVVIIKDRNKVENCLYWDIETLEKYVFMEGDSVCSKAFFAEVV